MDPGRNPSNVRRAVLIALQVGITAGAIGLVVRGLDIGETAQSLRKAHYWLLIPALALLLMDLELRAVRWRLLLRPQQGLRHSNLFGATNVGYLVNDVLPLRLGEVARTFLVDELENTGKVRAGASIAVERGIDVVAMILLVLALSWFIDAPSWMHGPALLVGIGVIASFALFILLSRMNESPSAFWKVQARELPRVGDRLDAFLNSVLGALHPLRQPQVLGAIVVLTAFIWTCATLSFLVVMLAFHLHVGLPAAALVLGATTLGMVVPSSPGYVGVFHAIAVETLVSVFGIPRESALTYAFAQHALIYFVPAALGAMFLWRQRPVWTGFIASLNPPRKRATPAHPATAQDAS